MNPSIYSTLGLLLLFAIGCVQNKPDGSQAKYTYGITQWQHTNKGVLVHIKVTNPPKIKQNIDIQAKVNTVAGNEFSTSKVIQFAKCEKEKMLSILVNTQGEKAEKVILLVNEK